ncbi:hypothetical protein [Microbacterium amylolyticum]|uniref:Uncharacterized protein n=1 Tax=Microbacterium amylolyticum TaxID=936337 RepID=A0ABS4ZEP1_9MICO|nr:hypothetical protein [Microbacterium amylolyticum]MBP2435763.1 hypothetical protein [Microbacterium amylolyticum]
MRVDYTRREPDVPAPGHPSRLHIVDDGKLVHIRFSRAALWVILDA